MRLRRGHHLKVSGLVGGALLLAGHLLVACTESGSTSSTNDDAPLVNQARTGAVSPFGPRETSSAVAAYAPGADASVAVYTSQVTVYDGTYDGEAVLSMEMMPSAVTQTKELMLIAPMMRFSLTDAEGVDVARPDLRRSLKVETIVDRFVDEENAVALIILGYGTADEERYMVVPEDMTFTIQEDNSRLLTFETRDTSFVFAMAAAKDGAPTNGFSRYPSVPEDNTDLTATSEGVEDEGAEVLLTWTPAEGSRTGYVLKYESEPFTTIGCVDGEEIPLADITSVREKFPKNFKDSYIATDLEDDTTAYFQLCSTNDRTPPDRSQGINIDYVLPKRALAVLTNAPASLTNDPVLAVEVGGEDVVAYQYAIVASTSSCSTGTRSDWIDVDTPITATAPEGANILCVYGKKSDVNVQTAVTSHPWTVDLTPPAAFTVSAVTTPTNNATPNLAWQAASGAASYSVTLTSDSGCATVVQTLTASQTTATPALLSDGTYYVCVQANDGAGNVKAATNNGAIAFVVDATPPAFTSLAGINEAVDGYLNALEVGSTDALAALTASGYSTVAYSDVLDNTPAVACTSGRTYGNTAVPDISAIPATDDSYAVCVKLTDATGNITYGKSAAIVRDTLAPTFTSLTLANDVADAFLNGAELASTASLATLSATSYSTATYSDVLDNTVPVTCDDQQTYGNAAVPTVDMTPAIDADYGVCVRIADAAGNAAYGPSGVFTRETVPPTFTSLDKANEASDGYVNAADVGSSLDVATLSGSDYISAAYTDLVDNDPVVTCDDSQTYTNPSVPAINTIPAGDGDYIVCVRLLDAAGNAAYGTSDVIVRDVTSPVFTSLDMDNEASDSYVNLAESSSVAPVAALTASGYSSALYSDLVDDTPAVTCDAGQTYGNGAIPAVNALPAVDEAYRLCVRLEDAAGNVTFGASDQVVRDVVPPTVTNIDSTTPAGSYGETTSISLAVETSEAVLLGGSAGDVLLLLETGATDRHATYSGGTGTNALTFGYVVQAGDASSDLDAHASAPQLSYSGDRVLADAAGNPLDPDVGAATSLASNTALVVDTAAPAVFNITAPTAASTVNDNTFEIVWGDPGDADTYTVKLDGDSGCPSPTQSYSGVVATSKVASTLADGVWYVCVTAYDAAGNLTAATNDNLSFTVSTGTWTAMTNTSAPAARSGATAVWTGTEMIVWGGDGLGGALGDGGVYVPPGSESWVATQSTNAPSARLEHTAIWTGTAMIVWGGRDGGSYDNTGALYDPTSGGTWTTTTTTLAPSARAGHTAVWTGTEMIIWGGQDGGGVLNDGGAYTPPGSEAWAATQSANAPAARKGHTAVWTGTEMLVWGGFDGGAVLGSGSRYDPTSGGTWTAMTSTNAPVARQGHVALWTGSKMIIFGGHDGSAYRSDGAMYDPVGDTWTTISATDAPVARRDALAVWDSVGSRMLLFGGFSGSYLGSGAAFDPIGNSWSVPALNAASVPSARSQGVAVWAGTQVLIWGGTDGALLSTGSRYAPP